MTYLTAGIWTKISTTSWVRQKTRMRREWQMNAGLWRRIRIEGEINTVSVNVGRAGKEKEELWSPKTGHWEWEEVKWRQRGQLWSHGGSWDLNFTDPTGNYSHCNIKGSKIIISAEKPEKGWQSEKCQFRKWCYRCAARERRGFDHATGACKGSRTLSSSQARCYFDKAGTLWTLVHMCCLLQVHSNFLMGQQRNIFHFYTPFWDFLRVLEEVFQTATDFFYCSVRTLL